ncbi:ATP-binding protein [Actinosynnema pretiosum]|uniref:XRE family transcriptional regulator n=1 Tax=Actinosynnema pretiosum TaxID=42197 RepID=A0A290ZC28_9PSEU|nr:XRE family transcriptional regulator [Actinosynnema pretiosum]ATE56523.1 XRE family transcriptional regulator [Actinosynnema pretiosum]
MATPLGDLLRHHRTRAGLTQEDLAEGSGVSVRAISDVERGRARGPQRRTVAALADVLGLDGADRSELLAAAQRGRARATRSPGPRALPPDLPDLAGRADELAAIRAAAARARGTEVVAVHGAPGSGKTSLVVRAAHELAASHPGGCFFFALRGVDATPVRPDEVTRRVLVALGEDPPHSEAERTDRYRALLRERSTVLVLDNALDEAQVRPLLAEGARSLVLITSRQVLGGLEGVTRIGLDVLRESESTGLLAAVAGEARTSAEPEATLAVARLCGNLPLALRIAGNRLASRPGWTVAHLAARLGDERRRLSALTAGDLGVRPAFELSYRQLAPLPRALFRALSLLPGSGCAPESAAVALGVDAVTAEDALDELVDASLLGTAEEPGRYALHDLLRVFAGERLAAESDPAAVVAARERLDGWFLDRATTALSFYGTEARQEPADGLADAAEADAWLVAELSNWLGALDRTAGAGGHDRVLRLASAAHWYSDQHGDAATWERVFGAGVAAARALGSARDEAVQLNFLTWVLVVLRGSPERGLALHDLARAAAVSAGDVREQGWAAHYRALALRRAGDLEGARSSAVRARELFLAAGYPLGAHIAGNALGQVLAQARRHAEAEAVHRELLAAVRADAAGLRPEMRDALEAALLMQLADALAGLERWAEVVAVAREAAGLAAGARSPVTGLRARLAAGVALHRSGALPEARAELERALERALEPGGGRGGPGAPDVLGALADVLDDLGDPRASGQLRARAAELRSADR